MRMSVKKILALVLSIVMLLGIFTACGKKNNTPVTPNYEDATTSGVILLNTGALFSIRYDVTGNVDGISGDNDLGVVIMETYTDYEGKATTEVIKELIEVSKGKTLIAVTHDDRLAKYFDEVIDMNEMTSGMRDTVSGKEAV